MSGTLELEGHCWPTRSQTWLLRAALLPREPALQSWAVWRGHIGALDGLDAGSQRLLPLLWKNLRMCGVNDPLLGPIKAQYRRTWYHNQALFHQMADVLEMLRAAGIAT